MRRANGTGSIYKRKGKCRKPYRVRITGGWEVNKETGKVKQIVKLLGDFPTRVEAETALNDYLQCPYELKHKDTTFSELYEEWSTWYFETQVKSPQAKRTVTSAYAYCSSLYRMKIKEIRVHHMESCMENAYIIVQVGKEKGNKRYASSGTKARMKSLFNLMFDYAVRHEMILKNYARDFNVSADIRKDIEHQRCARIPFTYDEIQVLWSHLDDVKFVNMILIGIYTGFRPQELTLLKTCDVNLEEDTIFGGMKTEAGTDRYVPIHPVVKPLVIKAMEEANKLGSECLFNDKDGQRGTYMTYDKYRTRFAKVMKLLEMHHKPHETRHTFITVAKLCNINDNVVKLIVGHKIEDITERVYTHRTLSQIKRAMEQFEITPELNEDNFFDDEELYNKLI